MTKVTYNSKNNEWYTPPKYIDLARKAMGSIDLDPASSEKAQEIVQASRFHTKVDNGLDLLWWGNVWLNPPYSRDLICQFIVEPPVAKSEGFPYRLLSSLLWYKRFAISQS